jgi:hypothetical protein
VGGEGEAAAASEQLRASGDALYNMRDALVLAYEAPGATREHARPGPGTPPERPVEHCSRAFLISHTVPRPEPGPLACPATVASLPFS